MPDDVERAERARAAFFIRIAGVGRAADALRDDYTRPLFPLWLILDADGTLADGLRPLVERTHGNAAS
jgi:hypothetical protein